MAKSTADATSAVFDVPFWLARIEVSLGDDGRWWANAIPRPGLHAVGEWDDVMGGVGESPHEAVVFAIRAGNGGEWIVEEDD